jgi:hypothetical protein
MLKGSCYLISTAYEQICKDHMEQRIEDSQCVHMHAHGRQKQHQPDLLQPFAQKQHAWIHPPCRKQHLSCTMGSAIAQWARVWHFYPLLTTHFAAMSIVGKRFLSHTTTLRELCSDYLQLKSECTGKTSLFGYLWMIDFCSPYEE